MALPNSRFRRHVNPWSSWPFQVQTSDPHCPDGWAPVMGWVDYYQCCQGEHGHLWALAPLTTRPDPTEPT